MTETLMQSIIKAYNSCKGKELVNSKKKQNFGRHRRERHGVNMHEFDDAVLQCFLENQGQLFPEGDVASSMEEAEAFLDECLAVVVNSIDEVWEFFEEEGLDVEGMDKEEILEADEVFDVGDGRYLIVEG